MNAVIQPNIQQWAVPTASSAEDLISQCRREQNYKAMLPCLQTVGDYLKTLAVRLNSADSPIRTTFVVPAVGPMDNLEQWEYRVSISERGMHVALGFIYLVPDVRDISVWGDATHSVGRSELGGGLLRYRSKVSRESSNPIECYIPASIELEGDLDRSVVNVRTHNLAGYGDVTHTFACGELAQKMLRELAKQIEGQSNRFLELDGNAAPSDVQDRFRVAIEARELEHKQLDTMSKLNQLLGWLSRPRRSKSHTRPRTVAGSRLITSDMKLDSTASQRVRVR